MIYAACKVIMNIDVFNILENRLLLKGLSFKCDHELAHRIAIDYGKAC